jgi:hypothetical protein
VIILQNFLDHRNSLEAGRNIDEAGGETGK